MSGEFGVVVVAFLFCWWLGMVAHTLVVIICWCLCVGAILEDGGIGGNERSSSSISSKQRCLQISDKWSTWCCVLLVWILFGWLGGVVIVVEGLGLGFQDHIQQNFLTSEWVIVMGGQGYVVVVVVVVKLGWSEM